MNITTNTNLYTINSACLLQMIGISHCIKLFNHKGNYFCYVEYLYTAVE